MELSPQQDIYYIDTVSPIDYFIDTVTPSAIQLNKEKTMSIELDGPLYLGSNSLQQQVDQNTEDITELQSDVSSIEGDIGSLDNLATSDKSSLVNAINETLSVLDPTQTADYIKNSKGLESGEISTNASILPWVEEMSHSTFDLSKFTVVGSPNITDDGIASGFSSSNKITISNPIEAGKGFKIITRFKAPTSGTTYMVSTPSRSFILGFAHGSNKTQIYLSSDGSSWDILDSRGNFIYTPGTYYYLKFEFTGTQYIISCSTDGKNWTEDKKIDSTLSLKERTTIQIGGWNNDGAFGSEIDLKQFSITADGVEVFSGNKTGIDTIKPANYTVVGSPTISADGVASGFSNSNYIQTPDLLLNNYNSWSIPIYGKLPPASGTTFYDIGNGTSAIKCGCIYGNPNYVVRVEFPDNTSDNNFINISSYWGQTYSGTLEFNGSKYIVKLNFSGGATEITEIDNSTHIRNDVISYGYQTLLTSIDLNSFKIYVDGNLIYQPCLKIPYTESHTGSKIVNAIYRDRVTDMYYQFGYAPYYTLSDTNFTLPMGEIYGMLANASDGSQCMPSDRYVDLTLGASGSIYTAPANGWFSIRKISTSAGESLNLYNFVKLGTETCSVGPDQGLMVEVPARKGQTVSVSYTAGGAVEHFRFIYAVGNESEVA